MSVESSDAASRLRVAHLGSKGNPSKGGTERVVETAARRQAAAGHRVTVYGSRLMCASGMVAGVRVLALPTVAHKYRAPCWCNSPPPRTHWSAATTT